MQLTGVFEVLEEIEEIGAWVGDRIVLAQHRPWPVSLARRLGHADARWAFTDRCVLEFTRPPSARRDLHRRWRPLYLPGHLRLLE